METKEIVVVVLRGLLWVLRTVFGLNKKKGGDEDEAA